MSKEIDNLIDLILESYTENNILFNADKDLGRYNPTPNGLATAFLKIGAQILFLKRNDSIENAKLCTVINPVNNDDEKWNAFKATLYGSYVTLHAEDGEIISIRVLADELQKKIITRNKIKYQITYIRTEEGFLILKIALANTMSSEASAARREKIRTNKLNKINAEIEQLEKRLNELKVEKEKLEKK